MKVKRSVTTVEEKGPSSLKIHCPVYNHIKNTIVCSICCPLRDKCKEFQEFYRENRAAQDAIVNNYIESHRRLPSDSLLIIQYSLEVLRKMNDTYIWIGQDDRAQIFTLDDVLQAADDGKKPKHIFLAKQELILRYQLVPKSRQEAPARASVKAIAPQATETVEIEDKRKKRGKAVA